MIGILIIAHGTLGESLIHCGSHVMGSRPPLLRQLGVGTHDDPATLLPQAQQMIRELDEGQGVLILSDVYGATPCNLVTRLLIPGHVEGVAGVNLPMLVRALTYREGNNIMALVEKAISGGRDGVVHFSKDACKHHD
ncbi:PTS system, ascorbate-specific IIA component [Methylobacillus rhizosphaerae]|uniref:PTS system, ascorbate-specific IIA component n=1 Tax=Methylobacillus rhizosphaerae TaxID=551994 RepID=A0A238XQA9_9PROT|nr:PTS fructose transporter subunit IIA [Methylobacillus rhizosphaerae]SNR60768.1 PTS system, ascorbate-specific IIA component [Methylobacillus rhizosphaerae]